MTQFRPDFSLQGESCSYFFLEINEFPKTELIPE